MCKSSDPAYGVLDSGTDITIMGGKLFQKVATAARLKKRDLKKPDKTPRNYDQSPFTLDGCMDLDVTFDGKTMTTPVYIKCDAHEQLLLSEGVCRQLGMLHYHQDVENWRGGRRQKPGTSHSAKPAKLSAALAPEDKACVKKEKTTANSSMDSLSMEQVTKV